MSTLSLEDRFWSKVLVLGDDECWPWQATLINSGYGRIYVSGKHELAHRVAWRLTVGEIPDGMTIDHVCHNFDVSCVGGTDCQHRRCCNPLHLEAVTQRENLLRGRTIVALNAEKTHCAHGHEFSSDNTIVRINGRGTPFRLCRRCGIERHRKYRQRAPVIRIRRR